MNKTKKWLIVSYFCLIAISIVLIIISHFMGPIIRSNLLPIATHMLTLVLGALLGFLSAVAGGSRNTS